MRPRQGQVAARIPGQRCVEINNRFTGEQFDEGLNQYYLRARNYLPEAGRFTQRDSFGGWPDLPSDLPHVSRTPGYAENTRNP